MIVSLELEYFLQHTHQTFTFTPGLNTIRGRNEGGKTSILLGICYALFGASVLPLSMEDTVSWGHPVRNLKVLLSIQLRDELYLFTRSAAGAECRHYGGIVTGQKEVSQFAADLLGADAAHAMKLMIANQKSIAAALEEGPTALAAYIEDMAGMDLFDIILDGADSQWDTGSTKTLDEIIEDLQAQVDRGEPPEPDYRHLDSERGGLQSAIFTWKSKLQDTLQPAAAKARDAYAQAKANNDAYDRAFQAWDRAKATLIANQNRFDELESKIVPVDEDRIEYLEKCIADDTVQRKAMKAYKAYCSLEYPTILWEGDAGSFIREFDNQQEIAGKQQKIVNEGNMRIRELQAKKISGSLCGYCGEDFSQFPAVAEKNEKIEAECAALQKQVDAAKVILKEARDSINALNTITEANNKIHNFYLQYHEYVERDENTVPATLVWKGTVPKEFIDTDKLQAELNKLKKAKRESDEASVLVRELDGMIVEQQVEVQRLKSAIPTIVDLEPLKEAKDKLEAELLHIRTDIDKAEMRLVHIEQNITRMGHDYAVAKGAYDKAVEKLAEKIDARKKLIFHNNLIKKIRAARPLVAAQLWNVVLASASQMFSQLRGEQSIVTRGPKNFLVNGKSVKGLSGSAQDILGLAMRVALVKTFIPQCPFMLLDEPMAACDDERTRALLQFVNCSGFGQIILVTHENISADWSHNIVRI
jgi:DNA repair exonuclease SbcCD ATPase subunit